MSVKRYDAMVCMHVGGDGVQLADAEPRTVVLATDFDALAKRLEEAERDAARYRWLRERVFKDGGNLAVEIADAYDKFVGGSMADGLDTAIDTFLKARP